LIVGVWSPAQIGTITGLTPEEREANAQVLEERLRQDYNARADIIIYGVVAQEGSRVAVHPEFYVTDNWPEVSELFGRFDLAAALYAPNVDQTRALSGELSNRSQVLAFITQGLVQMIFQQYDDSRRAFDAALAINQDIVGQELIYVLRGNASLSNYNRIIAAGESRQAARLPRLLEQATADFQQAVAVNPDYSRGYAGLGSVEYLNALVPVAARGAWNQVSAETLDAIQKTFEDALAAEDRPPSADIPTKVAFGLGQVALLRYLQGDLDAGGAAQQQFESVLAEYNNGTNPRVKELAAEANARLGLFNRTSGNLQAARTYYQAALDLTDIEQRRLLFQRSLVEVTIEEKRAARDIDGAVAAYQELFQFDLLPTDHAVALFQYGKMLSEADRKADALPVFEEAVTLDLSSDPLLAAQLWVELGNQYYDAGRLQDSINAYQQAMALDPQGQGHLTQVIEDTQAELDAQPTDPATMEAGS
jgi:tetratricopeptide (TPR) repeat protein